MNAIDAMRRCRELGATITRKDGEVIVKVKGWPGVRTQHPSRRKNACHALIQLLKRLEREAA